MQQQDIPVYLFLGFLDAGKTKFIQETLEDKRMDSGERTLLLVCEEGEEEYLPERFAVSNVTKVTLESVDELTNENLARLTQKYGVQRVVIEYNGTWQVQKLFEAMPESWVIVQMMTFFDAGTFMSYNANMRQLVFDKIQPDKNFATQLVVFNRFKGDFEKLAFHKVVRAISRRTDIVYEYVGGKAEYDDIEDPMPFDVNAPVIEIEDKDFAWFYSDISDKLESYIGKTVKFKGRTKFTKTTPAGIIAMGREIMNCCEADIDYYGFAVKTNSLIKDIKPREWLCVTAKIVYEYNPVYRGEGPVLVAEKLERVAPPEERVATFY